MGKALELWQEHCQIEDMIRRRRRMDDEAGEDQVDPKSMNYMRRRAAALLAVWIDHPYLIHSVVGEVWPEAERTSQFIDRLRGDVESFAIGHPPTADVLHLLAATFAAKKVDGPAPMTGALDCRPERKAPRRIFRRTDL